MHRRFIACILVALIAQVSAVEAQQTLLENFPSYSQDDTEWCAWVSAQMVLKYYGYSVTPQKVAVKTFGLANEKWSQDAIKAEEEGLPRGLIPEYENAVISLSDNNLEIEEITPRDKEELLYEIYRSIDSGYPIIILSTAPWLYDFFANLEKQVPWLYEVYGDKYPAGPHASLIVGYSLDFETNEDLAAHPFNLKYPGVLTSLVSSPPVLRLYDPATAAFGEGAYWLSYEHFFDKTTSPNEFLKLIAVKKRSNKDLNSPTVQSFAVSPNVINSGNFITINFRVSDNDGSGLKQVELWRKNETSDWQEIVPKRKTLSGDNGPISGSFTDSPPAPGTYWYGVHVVDNAGNWNDERNSNTNYQPATFEPVEVEVVEAGPKEPVVFDEPFGSDNSDLALKGDIYYLEEGASSLPDFASLTPVGSIYSDVLDIPSRSFDSGFPGVSERFEWFAIRYTGSFKIYHEGDYTFRLLSDDGSRLIIDGYLVIDNDGLHRPKSVSGEVYLTRGQHLIEVDYFQGPKNDIALQLFWTPPGESESIFDGKGAKWSIPTGAVGVDVSDYQGSIDWSQVAGSGYSFAFVKATEGEGWTGDAKARQQNFEANMQGASSVGMLVGAYHFARPDLKNNAEDEARWFIDVAGGYIKPGYLRPVLDIQVGADALGGAALSSWVSEWMETVTSETGVEPLIYTNADYASNYLDVSLAQYDLWVAHWTYDITRSPNTGIWDGWAFWQHSDEGRVPGISGDVDLDLFRGSEADLSKFVISASSTGSEIAEEWNRTFGGAGDDQIFSVEITSDGGYILAGETSSFGTTGQDAWLIKTDAAGNELWDETFGGVYKAYDGCAYSVQPTMDGGFIFTEYNCGIGLWPEQPDQYDCNISVIRTDSEGYEVWREFGDLIKPTPDGGYIIVLYDPGLTIAKINSQFHEIWRIQNYGSMIVPEENLLQIASDGSCVFTTWDLSYDPVRKQDKTKWLLVKVDSNGNEIWKTDIDLGDFGDNICYYSDLFVYPTADGGYVLACGMGSYEANNSGNAWLVKTDSQGNEIWKETFEGYSDVLLRPTSDGGCLACLNQWIDSESESSDSLLVKADAEGNVAWSRRLDGNINDIQIATDGGYILSWTKESNDKESSSWVIRIDAHGNDVWTKAFDGSINQIRPIPNGGYILAGSTSSFGAGGSDAWLIKLVPA